MPERNWWEWRVREHFSFSHVPALCFCCSAKLRKLDNLQGDTLLCQHLKAPKFCKSATHHSWQVTKKITLTKEREQSKGQKYHPVKLKCCLLHYALHEKWIYSVWSLLLSLTLTKLNEKPDIYLKGKLLFQTEISLAGCSHFETILLRDPTFWFCLFFFWFSYSVIFLSKS